MSEQVVFASRLAGDRVTLPLPVRIKPKVRMAVKVAVQVLFSVIVTEMGEVIPEQSPNQPVKTEPESDIAVRVTDVLVTNDAEQPTPVPQLICVTPDGALVDVIVPLPVFRIVRVNVPTGTGSNVAVTDIGVVTVIVQVMAPKQTPPDQAEKSDPVVGVAVKIIMVPSGTLHLFCAQVMDVTRLPLVTETGTVPVPVPAGATST